MKFLGILKKELILLGFLVCIGLALGCSKTVFAFSTNVSVSTDQDTYRCAAGQKFKVKITITTEEVYEADTHKYIGYLAVLDNGWQQIKSWFISGGIVEYTFTLSSNDYVTDSKKEFMFAASVFPVDNFVEGASLCDKFFTVNFLDPSFELLYNANGGQCDVSEGEIIYNCPYGELPIPTREGYTFDGWYTSTSGGRKITEDTIVTEIGNQTIYAHWKANKYTIILDANGGVCDPLSIAGTYDTCYEELENVSWTAPAGHTFDGWYTSASGGTKISASSRISIAANHTLYAHWKARSYRVIFDANGGNVSLNGKYVAYGDVYGTLPIPEREGYIFDGWYTLTIDGKQVTSSTTVSISSNHTLYAHWTLISSSGGNDIDPVETEKKDDNKTDEKNPGVVKPPVINPLASVKPKLKVKIAGANKVKLSWNKVNGVQKYHVYRATSKNGDYNLVKTLSKSKSKYTMGKLQSNRKYYFKLVCSTVSAGQTVYSQGSIVSKKVFGRPKTPKITKAKEGSYVLLKWKKQKNAAKIIVMKNRNQAGWETMATLNGKRKSYRLDPKQFWRGSKYQFRILTYYIKDGVKIYSKYSNPVKLSL